MNKKYGLYPDDELVDCGMDRNEVDGNTAYFTDGYCDGYMDRLDAVVVPMSDDEEDDEDMFGV